jgi:hypothetical protein
MENNDELSMIERLLQTKSFEELSEDEKVVVLRELGSAHQYQLMQKVDQALVNQKADLLPDPLILSKLIQHQSKVKHTPGALNRVLAYRVPAWSVAAVVLITAAFVLLFLGTPPEKVEAVAITRVDTVYVSRPADTVYTTKVVYRYLEKKQNDSPIKIVGHQPASVSSEVGVNMKEKEELDDFLVSGS